MGWGVTVVGWLIAPIMNLLVNKFVSYIGFNASRKLRELEIHTLPKLEDMLRELEEQRMQKEAEDDRSAVKKLEQPCDLFSIITKSRTRSMVCVFFRSFFFLSNQSGSIKGWREPDEKKMRTCTTKSDCDDDINWLQYLQDAVGACIKLCTSKSAALFPISRPPPDSTDPNCSSKSAALLPISRSPLDTPAPDPNCSSSKSASAAPLPISRPPPDTTDPFPLEGVDIVPSLQRVRSFYQLACFYRNWSYEVMGITNYKVRSVSLPQATYSTTSILKRV